MFSVTFETNETFEVSKQMEPLRMTSNFRNIFETLLKHNKMTFETIETCAKEAKYFSFVYSLVQCSSVRVMQLPLVKNKYKFTFFLNSK